MSDKGQQSSWVGVVTDFRSDRTRLTAALISSASSVAGQQLNSSPEHTGPVYLVGTGFDFAEFGAEIAVALDSRLAGVACVWTEPSELPFDERVFAIQQHYIEAVSEIPPEQELGLLFAQSVIADKMEVLTILSRIMRTVTPTSITIAAIVIERTIKQELESFLAKYFAEDKIMFLGEEYEGELKKIRSHIAWRLDDRPVKLVPLMSRWLLERRFGPRPHPGPAPMVKSDPPKFGG